MTVHLSYLILLAVIGATWAYGFVVGYRLSQRCGVTQTASLLSLACIVPTAGLVFAVHLIATAAMLTGYALATPQLVAPIFLLVCLAAHRVSGGASRNAETPKRRNQEDAETPKSEGVLIQGFNVFSTFRRFDVLTFLPVLIVVGMYAIFLVDAVTRFPAGYDALSYHLPVAFSWMQTQRLDLVMGVVQRSYPENGMIVPFLLSFAKLEPLFSLVHLPKTLLAALTVYGLTRAVGVSYRGAVVAACVAVSIPIVVFQSFSAYVDLYAAASWLSALLALTWATRAPHERQRRALLVLAGLSAGVALGSKSTYLALAVLLGLVVVYSEWIRPQPSDRRPSRDREGAGSCQRRRQLSLTAGTVGARPVRAVGTAALFTLACSACSFFWFARGTVQAGNPIYPIAIEIGGIEILSGFRPGDFYPERTVAQRVKRCLAYPWVEKRTGGYPYGLGNGVGAAFTTTVPLGMLAVLFTGVLRRPRDHAQSWLRIYFLLALGGGLLLVTIYCEILRFVLPLMLVAVCVAAVLIDRLIDRFPRRTVAVLSGALMVTAVIAAFVPAKSFAGRVKDGRWDRAWFYQIPPLIDELEPGARVLNLGTAAHCYPLLGRELNNEVMGSTHWIALLGDNPMSAEALARYGIDYIYVGQSWSHDWPDSLPVELIYDDTDASRLATTPAARIYRVQPPTAPERTLLGPSA